MVIAWSSTVSPCLHNEEACLLKWIRMVLARRNVNNRLTSVQCYIDGFNSFTVYLLFWNAHVYDNCSLSISVRSDWQQWWGHRSWMGWRALSFRCDVPLSLRRMAVLTQLQVSHYAPGFVDTAQLIDTATSSKSFLFRRSAVKGKRL